MRGGGGGNKIISKAIGRRGHMTHLFAITSPNEHVQCASAGTKAALIFFSRALFAI